MEHIDCEIPAEGLPLIPDPAHLAGKSKLKAPEKIQPLVKHSSSSKRQSNPAESRLEKIRFSFDRFERHSDGGVVIIFLNNKLPRMPFDHGPPRRVLFGSAGNRRRGVAGGSLPMVILLGALLFCYFKLVC